MQRSNAFMDVRIDSALELIEAQLGGKMPSTHANSSQGVNVGWLSGAGTDPKSLLLQNNVLKAGMVLLRKKNTEVMVLILRTIIAAFPTNLIFNDQMRARLAAAMSGDAFSTSPPKRRGLRSTGHDDAESNAGGHSAAPSRAARDHSEEDAQRSDDSDAEAGIQQQDGVAEDMDDIKKQVQEKQRKQKEEKARRAFNNLPAEHQEFIWKVMVGRIGEVVESHPLSSSVHVSLKEDVVLETALQIREVMASILVLPVSEVQQQQNNSLSNDTLFATVSRALASSAGKIDIT
jgi:hypothetical protein